MYQGAEKKKNEERRETTLVQFAASYVSFDMDVCAYQRSGLTGVY